VRQQDFAWHDQTGAPRDPQAGNIGGGKRDVLRSASFDSGSTSGFFADSGVWASTGGVLQVQAQSIGKDAVSVFHVGDALPTYFEVQASVMAIKPTSGWNANSYLVFDYQGKQDFKFAGIDVSTNKLVMGHRDAGGWHVDKQAPVTGGVKADKYYNMVLAVNGVNAMLLVDNKLLFTHTYQPRIVDGVALGLNWGMVGVGSDNSRGAFDNIRVQVLPPQITLNALEDFDDGVAQLFTGEVNGTWSVGDGRYRGAPVGEIGFSLLDLGPDHLKVSSYLELNGTVNATGVAGYVFDRYGDTSFKFAAIDAPNDRLVIGHYTKKSGWAIDASFATPIDAGEDYTLNVALKGTTVNATLSLPGSPAQAMLGFAFNAATVDGSFGLLAKGGTAGFDDVRIKTDDPAFIPAPGGASMLAATTMSGPDSGSTLTQSELDAVVSVAMSQWIDALGDGDPRLAALADVRFGVAELADAELGYAQAKSILIDRDGAGTGWSAPGGFDLVTVVAHELGHVLGFDHEDAGQISAMGAQLEPGVHSTLDLRQEALQAIAAPAQAPLYARPKFDLDTGLGGASPLPARIDWQSEASGWNMQLSPYAPKKPARGAEPNFVPFDAKLFKETGFDKLGRALLGKGKPGR
jgi:hypothetical protein